MSKLLLVVSKYNPKKGTNVNKLEKVSECHLEGKAVSEAPRALSVDPAVEAVEKAVAVEKSLLLGLDSQISHSL